MSKYLRVMGLCFSSGIVIALIGFVTTVGWTPPSQAQDDVCDGLEGDAYDLCDAYCNAKKCGTDQQKGSDKACDKLLNSFRKQSNIQYAPCNDPCADLVNNNPANECPCYYLLVPMTPDCWGACPDCDGNPVFDPCLGLNCTAPAIIRPHNSCFLRQNTINHVGDYALTARADPYPDELSCFTLTQACDPNQIQSYILDLDQYATCLCRVAQYATQLNSQPDVQVNPNLNSYDCE